MRHAINIAHYEINKDFDVVRIIETDMKRAIRLMEKRFGFHAGTRAVEFRSACRLYAHGEYMGYKRALEMLQAHSG